MKIKDFLKALFLVAFLMVSCSKKVEKPEPVKPTPEPEVEKKVNPVSQFAYDGLAVYYKWADNMKHKKPTVADNNPKEYFQKLLYKADTDHGWSWITDDIEGLLKGFEGKSLSFGYELKFLQLNNKIYATIRYVFEDTPASEANLKSTDLIGELNGKPIQVNSKGYIDRESIKALFGNNQTVFTIYKKEDKIVVKDRDVTITPREISKNPVVKAHVYTIGDKKIGYLLYSSFTRGRNNELYKAFTKFKNENVTELILDLRYNRGGALSSATYLASMIAPASVVQSKTPFTRLIMNDFLTSNGWGGAYKLGEYNKEKESNPMDVNLNLNKVYYIGTGGSYSAAELTPHCLKPFMDVIHIGSKTGGKYTASQTITPYRPFKNSKGQPTVNTVYDESKLSADRKKVLRNWAMQPIVAVYTDKDGKDFSKDDGLIPESENILREDLRALEEPWSTKDVFVGQALYLITGDEQYKPKKQSARGYQPYEEIQANMSTIDKILSESVILDNIDIPQNELQEALESNK